MGVCFSNENRNGNKTPLEDIKSNIRGIMLIQSWYRRHKARMELRQRRAWEIYQAIEYKGEQDELKLALFFQNLLKLYPRLVSPHKNPHAASLLSQCPDEKQPDSNLNFVAENPSFEAELLLLRTMEVESGYRGAHLEVPLSLRSVLEMIQSFRLGNRLHQKYVVCILLEAMTRLKSLPNVNSLSLSLVERATVVGDLHGSLDDLLAIFDKNGIPSSENPYIFNGDFVDRQEKSVEVVCILYCFLILFPGKVLLNRGNHEDSVVNFRYGFSKEIFLKYPHDANLITTLFNQSFSYLPLATIVDQKVFIVHGGVSNDTDLEQIEQIPRHKYPSILEPPEGNTASGRKDLAQLNILLWSDPSKKAGSKPNSHRGGGIYFGPDVTQQFLARYQLQFIIRSHECYREGFLWGHQDKLLTVFSVSDYYEASSNLAAYVILTRGSSSGGLGWRCHQFSRSYSMQRRCSLRGLVFRQEMQAINGIKEIIVRYRSELLAGFQRFDVKRTGFVSLQDWVGVMESVTNLKLPWISLRNFFAVERKDGIDYKASLRKFEVTFKGQNVSSHSITTTLYQHQNILEGIFMLMDEDHSGSVSLQEFEKACVLLNPCLDQQLSQQEIHELAQTLDINKDGEISFNEFLECFRIIDSKPFSSAD